MLHRNSEPIPGYKLKDRIGAGGYGEVWECEAPGGLNKAIKFVYGRLDDERAARELKSLNRVKSARHPFLLSLERIEVIDGQLVIVTELAEKSLKERFEECKSNPSGGIPRDELLIYLQDTADALDYMNEQHSLQHLDVKPENLLLLGGRVKVADFGLVKELREVTASLMGGLTPLYAPPEVFDGRPSKASDQYSLAIVYQEMLTGLLPFSGATAAQLAAQHLNAKPRTSPLSPDDRAVIEKALSKDPRRRFANCRELVAALCAPKAAAAAAPSEARESVRGDSTTSKMGSSQERKTSDRAQAAGSSLRESQAPPSPENSAMPKLLSAPSLKSLGPIAVDQAEATLRPVVLLGVGGLATEVLRRVRRRIHDEFGSQPVPAIQFLAVDTDQKSLLEAARGGGAALEARETLAAPLRRPQDYRNDSSLILQSMSRRWLYNIPRSQQTEGLRPLGRLALIDSVQPVFERLCDAIRAATTDQAAAAAREAVQMSFRPQAPRVVIIASICGGAGSGAAPELGYLARKALRECGFENGAVRGMLAYGSSRNPTAKDLAMANAFACLSEVSQYSRPDYSYPGDPALGLESTDEPPYDDTYVVSLGDELTDEQFESGAEQIAAYLYLDSVSSAAPLLEQCRAQSERNDASDPTVHTFGLCQVGGVQSDLLGSLSDTLCYRMLQGFRGETVEPSTITDTRPTCSELTAVRRSSLPGGEAPPAEDIEGQAQKLLAQLQLTLEALLAQSSRIIRDELEGDPLRFFDRLTAEFQAKRGPDQFGEPLLETMVQILGPRRKECPLEDLSKSLLGRALQDRLAEPVAAQGAAIAQWALGLADQSRDRLKAVRRGAKWCLNYLKELSETTRELTSRIEHELDGLEASFFPPPPSETRKSKNAPPPPDPAEQRRKYFERRLNAMALQGARALLRMVSKHIVDADNLADDLQRNLAGLAAKFQGASGAAHSEPGVICDAQSALVLRLRRRSDELCLKVEEQCRNHSGLLLPLLQRERSLNQELIEQWRGAARTVLLAALKESDLAGALGGDDSNAAARLNHYLSQAKPLLSECGGWKRLLLLLPHGAGAESLAQRLRQEFDESPMIARHSGGDGILCYECHGISLPHAAVDILQGRADLAELAARLRTRSDIAWNPWPAPCAMAKA